MIDARPGLEAAEHVSLRKLASYLQATGWKQVTTDVPVFSINFPGADEAIIVALATGEDAPDGRRRIADVLQTLAVLEERDVVEIALAVERGEGPRQAGQTWSYTAPSTPKFDGFSDDGATELTPPESSSPRRGR